jgi:hypothetical protein
VQMKMKLAPLRHALEEIVESKRIAANVVERLGGAKFALTWLPLGDRQRWHGQDQDQDDNCAEGSRDSHDKLPDGIAAAIAAPTHSRHARWAGTSAGTPTASSPCGA